MGVYLYTLRKSKPRNTPLGKVYSYEYKERMAEGDHWCEKKGYIECYEEQEERMDRFKDNFGGIEDCLVSVGGDEGCAVYLQKQSCPVWYDCNEVAGFPVGILRKRKNRWYVSSLREERDMAIDFLCSYACRNEFSIPIDLGKAYTQCCEHFKSACLSLRLCEDGYGLGEAYTVVYLSQMERLRGG